MTKPARPIATVAASLTAIAIVGLFAVQMRYVATSMDLVSVPQAQAAALQSAPASPATDADGTVVVEYCSEAVAARDPGNPAGRTSTRLAFDDAWFSTDAGSYNHDLATTCAVLSAVCNSESRFYSSDGAEDPYAEHALASLGFQHVRTESYALRSTVIDQVAALVNGTHGTSAYTLAAKRLPSGDTLAFVGVRGTYGAEWLSNFSIFDAHGRPDHEGYRIAEREVADALASYLREIGADPSRTRVLATGHSRGGAIANLLAAEIADRANGPDALARADGVYAYTFAAPGTTRSKAHDAAAYRGIFNIVNPSDIVPQLPLSSWGYGRYGTTVALPGVGDPRFEAALAAMRQAYERNTGHADYCGPDALASLAAFGSKAAKLLPTPDSLLNPAGAFSALQQLAAIDAGSALLAHYPDTYIAWMQAVDESALSFARAGAPLLNQNWHEPAFAEFRADRGNLGSGPAERGFAPTLIWRKKGRLWQKITGIGRTVPRPSRLGPAQPEGGICDQAFSRRARRARPLSFPISAVFRHGSASSAPDRRQRRPGRLAKRSALRHLGRPLPVWRAEPLRCRRGPARRADLAYINLGLPQMRVQASETLSTDLVRQSFSINHRTRHARDGIRAEQRRIRRHALHGHHAAAQGAGKQHRDDMHVNEREERVGPLLHALPPPLRHARLHARKRCHAQNRQQHDQRHAHSQPSGDERIERARSQHARHIRHPIHGDMAAYQDARDDGQLRANGREMAPHPRFAGEHADEHHHREQGDRQHALLQKEEHRAFHDGGQQPLRARQVQRHQHGGQRVPHRRRFRDGRLQSEHGRCRARENHQKRHASSRSSPASNMRASASNSPR